MPAPGGAAIEIRRADQRFLTRADRLESRSSFSFGAHYDPDDVGFGPLIVCNEDVLEPGGGFPPHPHAGMEILTWVLSGALRYADSEGRAGVAVPGRLQRMSAGRGTTHSEYADGPEPAHYVQMWLTSDEPDAPPAYDLAEVDDMLSGGRLTALASGRPGVAAALPLRRADATFSAARVPAGAELELPEAPLLHVLMTGGSADLIGVGAVRAGDAVRMRDAGPHRLRPIEPAELLVWEMHAT